MGIFIPTKSIHDFHLKAATSLYILLTPNDSGLPKGFKFPKAATHVILHSVHDADKWKSNDGKWFTPIDDKPVKVIIRQGERNEIIAIFPDELVVDSTKRSVQVWSSIYGYRSDTAHSAFKRTEDYEGSDFVEWADIIAKTVGQVIRTVKNL